MKKIIALWGILLMFVSILPAGTANAEEESAVDQAKTCVDAILFAAQTPEDYVFAESLAEHIDTLGKLLQGITNMADMESLDAYVAEKTTTEEPDPDIPDSTVTVTHYRSVQTFYQDYADVQNETLNTLAQPIDKAVEDFLAVPLVRENYERARGLYDKAEKHIKAAVNADYVNAMNQIRELLELAEAADKTFSRIQELTSESDASDYVFFAEDIAAAKTAYGLYESKFTELRRYGKYANCLAKAMKNTLFTHYPTYQKALLVADVEKAYDDLGVYDELTDTVREKLDVLQSAVDAGRESEFSFSVYDYYRGEAIQFVLTQYHNIEAFEEMMAMTSETPANKTELTAALRAYRYFNEDLTAEEKDLVPSGLVEKMNHAVLLNTDCEEVKEAIDEIGWAYSENEYDAFAERYNKAYKAYRLFVNTYSGIRDIPELITNIAKLDAATDVLEMISSIHQIEETEDALMCSKKLQIESLLNGYDRMSSELKSGVYNIETLEKIYEDVQTASDLRRRIDLLRGGDGGYTLLDEQYVRKIRTDYEGMTQRAKRYFGESYLSQMVAMEKELDAQNLNAALRVSTLIRQIGAVDATARDRIQNARRAYDGLSAIQKTYVTNYAVLQAAEEKYSKLEISVAKAKVSGLGSYSYTASALTPTMTVQLNGITLVRGMDYTVSYSSNINAGTAKATIRGVGYYTGSLTKTFTIRPVPVTGADVSGCKAKYGYTGKAVKPAVKIVFNHKILRRGVDYTVSYKNNKKRGSARVVIRAMGNYTGSMSVPFTIVRSSVKKAKVTGLKKAYRRTGKAIRPKFKVKLNGVTLKKKRDYLVTYRKNKKRGKATIVIKGTGNYSGSKKVTYKIV